MKPSGRTLLVVALLAAALINGLNHTFAQSVPRGIEKSVVVQYYPVGGHNWREITQEILAKRRRVTHWWSRFWLWAPEQYEADTEDRLEVVVAGQPAGTCRSDAGAYVATAKVTVHVAEVIVVPGLPDPNPLSFKDQECWAAYDRDLEAHEEGHMRKAFEAGNALLANIRARPTASCRDLEDLRQVQWKRLREAQKNYDALTSHGSDQAKAYGSFIPKLAYGRLSWCH